MKDSCMFAARRMVAARRMDHAGDAQTTLKIGFDIEPSSTPLD